MALTTLGALAIGLGSSLLGSASSTAASFVGGHQNFKRQRWLNEQQNQFNREEAEKARNWQESMYKKYNTVQAQAAQYRSAGINPYVQGASGVASSAMSASPVAASGSSGSAPGMPDVSGLSNFGSNAISAVNASVNQQNADTAKSNGESSSALNDAQIDLLKTNKTLQDWEAYIKRTSGVDQARIATESMRTNLSYLQQSLDSRVKIDWCNSMAAQWTAMDVEFSALSNQYSYYNILPEQVRNIQAQTINFGYTALNAYASGKLTLAELRYLPVKYAIQQTTAQAAYMQGQASLENAATNKKLGEALANLYGKQAESFEQDIRDKKRLNDYLDGKYYKAGHKMTMFEKQMALNFNMTTKTIQKLGSEKGLNINMSNYYEHKGDRETFGQLLGFGGSIASAAILKGK